VIGEQVEQSGSTDFRAEQPAGSVDGRVPPVVDVDPRGDGVEVERQADPVHGRRSGAEGINVGRGSVAPALSPPIPVGPRHIPLADVGGWRGAMSSAVDAVGAVITALLVVLVIGYGLSIAQQLLLSVIVVLFVVSVYASWRYFGD
jgi:hypothetical protein